MGDLEQYAASQINAGLVSDAAVERIEAARQVAEPFCADPTGTAANPGSVAQLRALVPTVAATLGTEAPR